MNQFAPSIDASASRRGRAAPLRVAIAGLGAIGLKIANALDLGIAGCVLTAVSANDRGKAAARLSHLARPPPVVGIGELEPLADLVIECAPASLLPAIAEPFIVDTARNVVLATRSWVLSRRDMSLRFWAWAVRLTAEPVSQAMPPVTSTTPAFSEQT